MNELFRTTIAAGVFLSLSGLQSTHAEVVSDIAMSYAVAGFSPQGFDMMSKAVDQVMAEQIGRLKKLIES